MRVFRVLGVIVVGRVWDRGVRVAVVAFALLAAAMVLRLALGFVRAFVPVDVVPGPVVPGD